MNFIKKLFSKKKVQNINKEKPISIEEKLQHKVYPRIKNINSINTEFIYHEYLGGDLVLIFIQDINDEMSYVLKTEEVKLNENIKNWRNNIKEISFNLFTSDTWNGYVFFNESNDYSNEKIFDPLFIENACQKLNTDKIIISISRRYKMQVTDFYNEFEKLELFFYNHFVYGEIKRMKMKL